MAFVGIRIGKAVRLPVDRFCETAHIERDALPEHLRNRLVLTVTEAAALLEIDPRTLRANLADVIDPTERK